MVEAKFSQGRLDECIPWGDRCSEEEDEGREKKGMGGGPASDEHVANIGAGRVARLNSRIFIK
jgi:hypothetical protein